MEPDGLFIYGNLRTGGACHAWLERTHPIGIIPAHVPGRLFHLPLEGYPVLVPCPEPNTLPPGPGWVYGEFVGYEDAQELEAALADLDQLENTDGDLFERHVLPVILESGHRYGAWVYLFSEDRLPRLKREAIELPGGDWSSYLGYQPSR